MRLRRVNEIADDRATLERDKAIEARGIARWIKAGSDAAKWSRKALNFAFSIAGEFELHLEEQLMNLPPVCSDLEILEDKVKEQIQDRIDGITKYRKKSRILTN